MTAVDHAWPVSQQRVTEVSRAPRPCWRDPASLTRRWWAPQAGAKVGVMGRTSAQRRSTAPDQLARLVA
jgi:phage baseplate assembly protein gpV